MARVDPMDEKREEGGKGITLNPQEKLHKTEYILDSG